MAVTRLSLLPEFSTSAAVPVWVVEVLVMVCDSTGACEPMPEVSMSVAGLSVAEGVGVTMMKPSLASSGRVQALGLVPAWALGLEQVTLMGCCRHRRRHRSRLEPERLGRKPS